MSGRERVNTSLTIIRYRFVVERRKLHKDSSATNIPACNHAAKEDLLTMTIIIKLFLEIALDITLLIIQYCFL